MFTLKNGLFKAAVFLSILTSASLAVSPIKAGENHHHLRADGHAPIGVMGDHMHKKGEWMISYRFMQMGMQGNQIGKNNVTPESIVTTIPNRFFGTPGQPPTLRVVPTKMTMSMHMLGAMYAPSNNVTLMAMLNILDNKMDHITFQGGMGQTRLGTFTTRSKGIGDLTLGGLIGLYNNGTTKVHFNAGLSVPTGSITERAQILTPMGATPTLRMPYAMQLGTGTWDLLPGVTIQSRRGDITYGAQYKARFHLGENDEDYSWGDKHEITTWVAYQWAPWVSTSLRLGAMTQDNIDGIDSNIVAPVQTANPNFYGGERLDLFLGINLMGQTGPWRGHRLAAEFGIPLYQDLNGPQMETDYQFAVGWQKAF